MAIYWLNSVNLSTIDWVDTNLIEYFTENGIERLL